MTTQQRFVQNLAAGMLAGEWTAAGIRESVYRATGRRFAWGPALAKRLLNAHATAPTFPTLLATLTADAGFQRGLTVLASARNADNRFPVWHLFSAPAPPPLPRPQWAAELPDLPNEPALAEWLGVSLERLLWLADTKSRNTGHRPGSVRTYRARWVPKTHGRARLLEVPIPALMRAQRKILAELLNLVPAHPAVHGFRPGHSAITNAAQHCGRACVIRFDLTDFFPSIPVGRIFRMFLTLGYSEPVARLFGCLCTTRLPAEDWNRRPNPRNDSSEYQTQTRLASRHVPQGAPTSPALANLTAYRLDCRLAGLASACGATYSRYADDLTFSGDDTLRRSAARLARRVALIVVEEGFALNRGKTRVQGRGERQLVTGVVVNVRPNIPREDFDQLKAILTNCVRHNPATQNRTNHPDFRAHLAGRIAHVASVNPTRGRKLWATFDRIVWDTNSAQS
ncbi:reverse transcriptase : Retron-type RNA-directed DNA polymerase protein OS=Myxococcus sp. (contaminant ex DSM 436) GN=A176_05275 PE=4 SV=1: RVT_1 [Gemmata massiliana]|uniref:RNA-directed DNA polymerase n=1 Tax=Gemmata massiliana TaxID=1210884 RepID=A0A6P2D3V5_9BACT|nr:reverse transcriptase family protein [Gemmata massiliana]VTR95998.1 reverse transcriptase : Retron-type RNA-directed DNA polymerase protein OS=Myxococcus sp. (contaminant ex DSM 436) GN=A176_05275 PE=4 SV=1: RVT_1 [Gemmata massiliana]